MAPGRRPTPQRRPRSKTATPRALPPGGTLPASLPGGEGDAMAAVAQETLAARLEEIWEEPHNWFGVLGTVDHKIIGQRYLVTAFVFLLLGGIEAALIRAQLARPEQRLLSPEAYNQIF